MNWEQLKTILWLRWRLTQNQWTRSRGLGVLLAALMGVSAVLVGGASLAGGLLGGLLGLKQSSAMVVSAVWAVLTLVFLFVWMIGLITELQRSETIDLQRLMHLPVSLGQIFVVNYIASHFALSIVLFVPAMIGLALGLTFSRGPALALMLPLALAMVFMITAWTYCLRGWLATLMANPRRRRTVIVCITLAFVLLGQGPNLYFNVLRRSHRNQSHASANAEAARRQNQDRAARNRETQQELVSVQKFIPPLWVSLGAGGLVEGRFLPALLGTLGCGLIGGLGLRRAYRTTLKFYHGEDGSKRKAKARPAEVKSALARPVQSNAGMVAMQLPWVSEEAAAVALATFRSMLRAPEVKMAWISSVVVTLILAATVLTREAVKLPADAKPFLATGSMVFVLFMGFQFLANQFGYDRNGFRVLVLSPIDRRQLLLGKNMAALCVNAAFGFATIVLVSLWLRLPVLTFLATLFQFVSLQCIAAAAGNLVSIYVPFRIQAGSLKPTKPPPLALITMIASQLLFPLALTPAFVPPLAEFLWRQAGLPALFPVNLVLSAGLATLAVLLYRQSLGPLGRVLQTREIKILQAVTTEVE